MYKLALLNKMERMNLSMPKIKQTNAKLMVKISGEPCSKANSRIMIFRKNGRPRSIKNKAAQDYVESFLKQVIALRVQSPFISGEDVILNCWIYYASYRKDLDESLIMDCLQKSGILKNDRQIKEKHIYHRIDKEAPHTIILIEGR